MDDKPSLKGALSGHMTHFKLSMPDHIFGMNEASYFKFGV